MNEDSITISADQLGSMSSLVSDMVNRSSLESIQDP